jgi:hypothetical protein
MLVSDASDVRAFFFADYVLKGLQPFAINYALAGSKISAYIKAFTALGALSLDSEVCIATKRRSFLCCGW